MQSRMQLISTSGIISSLDLTINSVKFLHCANSQKPLHRTSVTLDERNILTQFLLISTFLKITTINTVAQSHHFKLHSEISKQAEAPKAVKVSHVFFNPSLSNTTDATKKHPHGALLSSIPTAVSRLEAAPQLRVTRRSTQRATAEVGKIVGHRLLCLWTN